MASIVGGPSGASVRGHARTGLECGGRSAPVLISALDHRAVADDHRDVAVPHREVAWRVRPPPRLRFGLTGGSFNARIEDLIAEYNVGSVNIDEYLRRRDSLN